LLQWRRGLGLIMNAARCGFALQAFGLVALLFGVALVVVDSSFVGFLLSAVFVVVAGMSAIAGAVLLRRHYASNTRGPAFLIFGIALIFLGVGLIVASNIAFVYFISQLENTVYADIGATISACGCVLEAYSFFILHNHQLISPNKI
jgi:hypothetical protein